MTTPIIRIRDLHKIYKVGAEVVRALRGVDLDIHRNEFVAIMGASGSGKSTLMNVLGCLDQPTKGVYELSGKPTHKMNSAQLAKVRNEEIGFVFQSFELLNRASALKNVTLPLVYSGKHFWGARRRAKESLTRVGLADRMDHRPNQLSGGQRQRVAIARALVTRPVVLMADEPTGNLDSATGRAILNVFDRLNDEGMTIIMVTHDPAVSRRCKRVVRLGDGVVEFDRVQQPERPEEPARAVGA